MEWTNLIFAGALLFLMFSGMAIFFNDVQSNYPMAAQADPQLNYTVSQMNTSMTQMNTEMNQSMVQASTFTTSDNPLTAAFGYLLGAFSAVKTLLVMPAIFMNFISLLGAFAPALVPNFVLSTLIIALTGITLVGLLYYLLKVK